MAPTRPQLRWDVARTAAHLVEVIRYYERWASGATDVPSQIAAETRAIAPPRLAVAWLTSFGELLAALQAAPGGATCHHAYQPVTARRLAAMALNEILVHEWDVRRGLGQEGNHMPRDQAAAVVRALFPSLADAADPRAALLHATGRVPLPGRSFRGSHWLWE